MCLMNTALTSRASQPTPAGSVSMYLLMTFAHSPHCCPSIVRYLSQHRTAQAVGPRTVDETGRRASVCVCVLWCVCARGRHFCSSASTLPSFAGLWAAYTACIRSRIGSGSSGTPANAPAIGGGEGREGLTLSELSKMQRCHPPAERQ